MPSILSDRLLRLAQNGKLAVGAVWAVMFGDMAQQALALEANQRTGRDQDNERLRQRCEYFGLAIPFISGARMQVKWRVLGNRKDGEP